MEWQPIESVPKDGTDIFLAEVTGALHVGLAWGEIDVGCWGEIHDEDGLGNPVTFYGWTSNSGHIEEPTHWMPLPAPPAKRQREE